MSGQVGEPRLYRAGLALGAEGLEAVVFEIAGCHCVARDEASARALLPVVIAEHIAWLDQHGDVTRDVFPFEVEVVETVELSRIEDEVAEGEFCFDDDLRPSSRDEIETAIRRMGYARSDLLSVVRHLPDSVLDWRPPPTAVRQDSWAPGVRSIRDIVHHIAGADGYYAGNVGSTPMAPASEPERSDVFGQRSCVIERLRGLADDDLCARFERRQPWQERGVEHWTVRKALRRFVAHERFHTREIEQRLAWLLIGAPELAQVAVESAV